MLDRAELKSALETGDVERVFRISASLVEKSVNRSIQDTYGFWCSVVEIARNTREFVLLKFAATLLSLLNDRVRACLTEEELDFLLRDMVTFVEKMSQLAPLHLGEGLASGQSLKDH